MFSRARKCAGEQEAERRGCNRKGGILVINQLNAQNLVF